MTAYDSSDKKILLPLLVAIIICFIFISDSEAQTKPMRVRRLKPATIAQMAEFAAPATDPNTAPTDEPFSWRTDFDEAIKLAKQRHRYLLVVFTGSDWCVWCKKLDAEILNTDEFREYARQHVIAVQLDTPKAQLSARPHQVLMQKYNVTGYPTVLIIDPRGFLVAKGGYMQEGPQAFIEFLKKNIPDAAESDKAPQGPTLFDRSPQAILKAIENQMNPQEETAPLVGLARLQLDVTLGNWKNVKASLAELPDADGTDLFNRLVKELQATEKKDDSTTLKAVLTPEDFFALSDCAPAQLNNAQIAELAKLMQLIMESGDYQRIMLEHLTQGTPCFGGNDQARRVAAAKLLFAANMLDQAGEFLPDAQTARQNKNIDLVKMHIRYLGHLARRQRNLAALEKAWDLGQWILLEETANTQERQEALRLVLDLIPILEPDKAHRWLSERFKQDPDVGARILSTIGDAILADAGGDDAELRQRNLEILSLGVNALLDVRSDDSWNNMLNVLAWCWMTEGENTLEMTKKAEQQRNQRNAKIPPHVSLENILATAPHPAWLAVLPSDTFVKVEILIARLNMKADKLDLAATTIKHLSQTQPAEATLLAEEFLNEWSRSVNQAPTELYNPNPQLYRLPSYRYSSRNRGIPLTRARQVRNLEQLSMLLQDFGTFLPRPLNAAIVAKVFADCHSVAEVFQQQDIEAVFGPIDKLSVNIRLELVRVMRTRLNETWRDPEVQKEKDTKRTRRETINEVVRGYLLLEQLLAEGQDIPSWQYLQLLGMVRYDSAEFYYSLRNQKDVHGDEEENQYAYTLEEYTRKRNAAIDAFRTAAEYYGTAAPTMKPLDRTPQVYLNWFYLVLGASDLAHLKRSTDLSEDYLSDIRTAMLSLPGELADEHLSAFGDRLFESLPQVPENVKMRYLEAGLMIIGDHAGGARARAVVTYYHDLLNELELMVRIDGESAAAVGHTRNFGLFIELHHSRAIERESGGFARYVQNVSNARGYYPNNARANYRDIFENYITRTLQENFEIKSVTFADADVTSYESDRPYWRVTPLAYVLLKPKDSAVDIIPPIQMDMDFYDQYGQVVLPVVSHPLPIDAKAESPAPITDDLQITQTLDARNLKEGKIKLEIVAHGLGLIPSFDELFDWAANDLKSVIDDQGVIVDKLKTDDVIAAQCQRLWLITIDAPSAKLGSLRFNFPTLKNIYASAKMDLKRFADANIVDANAVVTLSTKNRTFQIIAFLVLLAVAFAALWIVRRRRLTPQETGHELHVLPPNLTPFTVLSFLRHIDGDSTLALAEKDKTALRTDMTLLERAYFSSQGIPDPQPDIDQIAAKWRKRV
ncbi:MAG: thioredoxin family protein [Sedimentisphaerales bacterium]|nr:thioredoxin family protein [Sedimentisphaerales bacterium]